MWIILVREYEGEWKAPKVALHDAGGIRAAKKTALPKVYIHDNWKGKHFDFRYLKGKSVKNTMRTLKAALKKIATPEEMERRRRRKFRRWEKEERVNVALILDLLVSFGNQFPEGHWKFFRREG